MRHPFIDLKFDTLCLPSRSTCRLELSHPQPSLSLALQELHRPLSKGELDNLV